MRTKSALINYQVDDSFVAKCYIVCANEFKLPPGRVTASLTRYKEEMQGRNEGIAGTHLHQHLKESRALIYTSTCHLLNGPKTCE